MKLYRKNPTIFLDEARKRFECHFLVSISKTAIWNILKSSGFTYETIERRAIQIRSEDIVKFALELQAVEWQLHNLVFLDEVSFDSRDFLRNKGYGPVGERVIFRGEFKRRPRVSLLCFAGQSGLLETFMTDGTFTRKCFFECCREFALSGNVQQFPGKHSVWNLDDARIHCHRSIIEYLRSLGINVVFLPAYTPFYNPIEYLFGYVKRYLHRAYQENSSGQLSVTISTALNYFEHFNMTKIFKKRGYFSRL